MLVCVRIASSDCDVHSANLVNDAQEGAVSQQQGGEVALESSQEPEDSISLAQPFPEINPHTDPLPASLQSLALFIGIQESASTTMLVKAITSVIQGIQQEHGY